ncbi:MAG: hypothetical protein JWN92_1618, partial [Candidatus Acidoferrum typicum]|nr:hypothetical protein [Candidatus Acidoferrum typicum]
VMLRGKPHGGTNYTRGAFGRQAQSSIGIGKDHRIPLEELKCMSPKRVKELNLYLGCAARRRGEEPGHARRIESAHVRRPLFRPGP